MSGGPSHLDLWDYKPRLKEQYNQQLPDHVRSGQRVTGMTANQKSGFPLAPSKYAFTRHENNDRGLWVSELLPHTATVAKELCVVHSTYTEAINHDPAITYIQTGSQVPGRLQFGCLAQLWPWNLNEDLPSYVVMHARSKYPEQSLFARLWGTGFMPSDHQGILLRSQGDPVLYLNNPRHLLGRSPTTARRSERPQSEPEQQFGDPEILSRNSAA